MEISHRYIDIHGIRTHYLIAGGEISSRETRPTVALLHGGGIDCAKLSWELFIPELARDFRVIALDWPGFGESDRPALPYSMQFYVEFLGAFLKKLNIRRASLVGISMGGAAALGFALRSPECVDKLVLVDSYGLQSTVPFAKLGYYFVHLPGVNDLTWALMRNRPMVRYSLQSLLKRPGAVTRDLVECAYREMTRPDAALAWTTFQKDEVTRSGPRTCYMDRLGEIRVPTLILHGSKDTLVPVEAVRLAHERIPGSRLYSMEGCGHWPQRDNPEEFNRVLGEFLRGG